MYPSIFREKSYMTSKEVLAKNPPSMTGYFDNTNSVTDALKDGPAVALNGQRADFRFGANTGLTFRVKDPNGSKDAVGFTTYRVNGLLVPGNTGKLVSMGYQPGEVLLGDAIFQGSRFQSPTIVSMVSTARPPDSTVVGQAEAMSGTSPLNSFEPVNPFGEGSSITPDGSQSGAPASILNPQLKFDDLNPKTGEEFLVPNMKDSGTPWGTNARTGTTKTDGSEFLVPNMPSNISGGWPFKGLSVIQKDLSHIFKKR